jgi:hypothetical protein
VHGKTVSVGIQGGLRLARCFSTKELSQYIIGDCTADERTEIQTHLAGCDRCSQAVHSISGRGAVQSQSEGPTSSEAEKGDISKKGPLDRDESPTRSMPGVEYSPAGKQMSGKEQSFTLENYEIVQELRRGRATISRGKRSLSRVWTIPI